MWYHLRRFSQAFALVAAIMPLRLHAQAHEGAHWTYKGKEGPSHWGALDSAYALCARGKAQSPINIVPTAPHQLPGLSIAYQPTAINILNNGHTIQVNYGPGSSIRVGDRQYVLKQFHFHHPSEETVHGRHHEMSLHLVHADAAGTLAVVAVLLDPGTENTLVRQLWSLLPKEEEKEERRDDVQLNAADLLPADRGYYTFEGSLTTPPCSENVTWLVLKQPVAVSTRQIAQFSKRYPDDARPTQPLHGRVVRETR